MTKNKLAGVEVIVRETRNKPLKAARLDPIAERLDRLEATLDQILEHLTKGGAS